MREEEHNIRERERLVRRSKVEEETLRRSFKSLSFAHLLLCFVFFIFRIKLMENCMWTPPIDTIHDENIAVN